MRILRLVLATVLSLAALIAEAKTEEKPVQAGQEAIVRAQYLSYYDNEVKLQYLRRGQKVFVDSLRGDYAFFTTSRGEAHCVKTSGLATEEGYKKDVDLLTRVIYSVLPYVSFLTKSKMFLWIALVLLVVSGVSLLSYLERDSDSRPHLYFTIASFLAFSWAEINYFTCYLGDATWFCSTREVGWIITIICFLLMAVVIGWQAAMYCGCLMALDGVKDFERRDVMSYAIGWGGFVIGFIGYAIFDIFYDPWAELMVKLMVWSQAAQLVVIVVRALRDKKGLTDTVLTMVVYIVGFLALFLIIKEFIYMLVFVLLAYGAAKAAGNNSTAATESSDDSQSDYGYGLCGDCEYFREKSEDGITASYCPYRASVINHTDRACENRSV